MAPPEAAQEGAQSLPSRRRGVEGALTTQPRVQAVLPVRNASASSMQSPPASAEVIRVEILSPGLARPGASPRSRCRSTSWGRPRCKARVAGRISPALATRRWSSKVIWIRSGWLRGSIYWVLLFWDRFSVSKPLSQIQRRTLLFLQQASHTPSFGGLGLTGENRAGQIPRPALSPLLPLVEGRA